MVNMNNKIVCINETEHILRFAILSRDGGEVRQRQDNLKVHQALRGVDNKELLALHSQYGIVVKRKDAKELSTEDIGDAIEAVKTAYKTKIVNLTSDCDTYFALFAGRKNGKTILYIKE